MGKVFFKKNKLNETSYASPLRRYTSDGEYAFYKDSDKRDIIEMSEFAFAIARTIIKNSKHELYAELLEYILHDYTFNIAMHGAKLPDLSDTKKLELDMGMCQGIIAQAVHEYKK